jgi:hypothetical protein
MTGLNDIWVESTRRLDKLEHLGSTLKDTLAHPAEKAAEFTYANTHGTHGHIKSQILSNPNLAIVNWTLFAVSASAAMLFGLLCYQARSKSALIPVVNLFVSVVMMMTYYGLAVSLLD